MGFDTTKELVGRILSSKSQTHRQTAPLQLMYPTVIAPIRIAGELDRHGGGVGAVPVVVANSDGLPEDASEVHAVRSRLPVIALST